MSSFFSCLFSLLPNSSSSHSNQSYMHTGLRLTFLSYVSETIYLSKNSQWLSTNYLTECKHLILTVKGRGAPGGFSSVFFQVSCIHRQVPVVRGTWPIHHASVKNCNESKIPSQLQPSKVAYYSFISAGGLHETLEEKQRKPDVSVPKNCRMSACGG